ncbi:hypothetical protein U9M48_011056 [Paspalum notatum var. saurae]|uniref:J domain-containing protein n=1 Tax=Paspalum notatum var. saurae TaxID=547442 RepID=A0AAQ3WH39_PASNO
MGFCAGQRIGFALQAAIPERRKRTRGEKLPDLRLWDWEADIGAWQRAAAARFRLVRPLPSRPHESNPRRTPPEPRPNPSLGSRRGLAPSADPPPSAPRATAPPPPPPTPRLASPVWNGDPSGRELISSRCWGDGITETMARKGNQSKSAPNHALPNWQSTADGDVLSTPESSTLASEIPGSHVQGRSKGFDGSGEKKGRSSKKSSRTNSTSSLGKQLQMDTNCDIGSSEENELPSRGNCCFCNCLHWSRFYHPTYLSACSGASFFLKHERIALLVACLYSMYCARSYVGWLGLLLSLNLSFFSSDALVQFLKNKDDNKKSNGSSRSSEPSSGRSGNVFEESQPSADSTSHARYARADRDPGDPSTSGAEKELTSEDEVARLLNCTDHYSALGFRRYENIDVSSLKREYKKKAMLVHPDKNMGNDKAADAFKRLQNAYEVLLDSLKRKTYDDELRREELLDYLRRFQSVSQKNGRNSTSQHGFSPSKGVDEGPYGLSRRIACKKCGDFHLWIYTGRAKSQARWCQDCKDFHQAKDGDGWVEQSFQPVLFGMLQKLDLPHAYVCAESYIFDVTEWFNCQGMRCPANTHKPSFHVNASMAKQSSGKGSTSAQRGGKVPNGANMDGGLDEEEFFEWFQNAVNSGMFEDTFGTQGDPTSPGSGGTAKGSNSSSRKKRKGKKQW